jgi:cytosine/adenosine deaminase-related metal-dependent hydrolase
VAATRNSAEFLRMADAGTLQAGKSADFIVLDANRWTTSSTLDASRR